MPFCWDQLVHYWLYQLNKLLSDILCRVRQDAPCLFTSPRCYRLSWICCDFDTEVCFIHWGGVQCFIISGVWWQLLRLIQRGNDLIKGVEGLGMDAKEITRLCVDAQNEKKTDSAMKRNKQERSQDGYISHSQSEVNVMGSCSTKGQNTGLG